MKANEVAWSDYFNSYIACIDYKTNKNWKFVKCDRGGYYSFLAKLFAQKARTNYTNYKWVFARGR